MQGGDSKIEPVRVSGYALSTALSQQGASDTWYCIGREDEGYRACLVAQSSLLLVACSSKSACMQDGQHGHGKVFEMQVTQFLAWLFFEGRAPFL
jgi:hypothetical protein